MQSSPVLRVALMAAATLACLFGTSSTPAADPRAEPDRAADVDRIFAKWDRLDSPGCAVGIVRGGEADLCQRVRDGESRDRGPQHAANDLRDRLRFQVVHLRLHRAADGPGQDPTRRRAGPLRSRDAQVRPAGPGAAHGPMPHRTLGAGPHHAPGGVGQSARSQPVLGIGPAHRPFRAKDAPIRTGHPIPLRERRLLLPGVDRQARDGQVAGRVRPRTPLRAARDDSHPLRGGPDAGREGTCRRPLP